MSHNAMVLNISSVDEWEPTATVLGIAAYGEFTDGVLQGGTL